MIKLAHSIDSTRRWLINGPLHLRPEQINHFGDTAIQTLRNHQQELTSVDTWTRIRDYAKNNNLARFTFWAVNRDRGCAGGGVVSDCSGIAQGDWEFTRISAGF